MFQRIYSNEKKQQKQVLQCTIAEKTVRRSQKQNEMQNQIQNQKQIQIIFKSIYSAENFRKG